jgi:hypothetical protein
LHSSPQAPNLHASGPCRISATVDCTAAGFSSAAPFADDDVDLPDRVRAVGHTLEYDMAIAI